MAHYASAERRLPASSYSSSSHLHPSHAQPPSFWRHPSSSSAPAAALPPHVDPVPPYAWQEQPPADAWNVPAPYVPYDPSADYVTVSPASDYHDDYLHPAVAPHVFAAAPHSRPCSSSSRPSSGDRPRFEAASWDEPDLYRFDDHPDPPRDPSPAPPLPRVKQEEIAADEFVFEMAPAVPAAVPHYAPMTEVPLRATQASKKMRKMMGVFRLDPFAMHNGQRGPAVATWSGEEIGPLKEAPRYFEFQLDLPGLERADPVPEPAAPPCSSSPSLPSPSPAPSLQYPYHDRRRTDDVPRWTPSPVPYAPSAPQLAEPSPFEPIMTPAQSLWQMNYQPESDASSYSLSPPASRESIAHRYRWPH